MDRPDRPDDRLDGAACAACGHPVPPDAVRVLAERDDLAFAELSCPACGSVSLAIVLAAAPAAARPAIGPDDVLDMHRFLADYTGDVRSLFAPSRREAG